MTARITLQPDGPVFIAEPGESILEAALRAGIPLKYNCNNGNCGQCLAWLEQGQTRVIAHHDFRLPEPRDGRRPLLMCCHSALENLRLSADLAARPADIPEQRIEARVYKAEIIDDILVLTLRTPRSQTLRFLAGQHVELQFAGHGCRYKSIASCPCNGMFVQFHFRYRSDDPLSQYLFNELKVRSPVIIRGPQGSFLFDDNSTRPVLFIAFETGFAPIKSIIEHAISLERSQPMTLYWLTHKPYQENYCRSWVDALDNFSYHSVTSDAGLAPGTDLLHLAGLIAGNHPYLEACDIYLNGPSALFDGMKQQLVEHGADETHIYTDSMIRIDNQ